MRPLWRIVALLAPLVASTFGASLRESELIEEYDLAHARAGRDFRRVARVAWSETAKRARARREELPFGDAVSDAEKR